MPTRTLFTNRHRRGHVTQFHRPLIVGAAVAPPSDPVVTRIRTYLARPQIQRRRAGHALGAPAIVTVPIFLPAAQATISAPPALPSVRLPAVAAVARAFVRSNLLPNSGFESGSAGWENFGGSTIAQSASQAHSGTKSGEIQQTLAAQASAQVVSEAIDVTPGERFALSAWARGAVADKAYLYVNHYDAADNYMSVTSISANLTLGTWTQINLPGTVPIPANTAYIRVGLVFAMQSGGNVAQNTVLGHFDDVQLEYGIVNTTLIPTDGGIASGWSLTFASSPLLPAALATATAPPFSFDQDIAVSMPAAVATATAPNANVTYLLGQPPALAFASAPDSTFFGFETIVFLPAAYAAASAPAPCLHRFLALGVSTPGTLALEPLLPPDTC